MPGSWTSVKTKIPSWSPSRPNSSAEQTIPCDSTPLIVAGFKVSDDPVFGFIIVEPALAKAINCPTSIFGAPHTTWIGSASPTSTVGSCSRSALG